MECDVSYSLLTRSPGLLLICSRASSELQLRRRAEVYPPPQVRKPAPPQSLTKQLPSSSSPQTPLIPLARSPTTNLGNAPHESKKTAAMSANIQKTVARLREKIAEGQYYEAQQQTRVVAARYIKARKWDAAVDMLHSVAQALLGAGQGGSGGDLCLLLAEVYEKGEVAVGAGSKGKVLGLLRLFEPGEPTRKRFIGQIIGYELSIPHCRSQLPR